MEAQEWAGAALHSGNLDTMTQGSPVCQRSLLVDVGRELRSTDHPLVPDSSLSRGKCQWSN